MTSTAQIGCFKIVSESSVGANLRRIEAITSREAIEFFRGRDRLVDELAGELKTEPDRLRLTLAGLKDELKELRLLAKAATAGKVADIGREMALKVEDIGGLKVLAEQVDVSSPDEMMELSDRLREELNPAAVFLALAADGRVTLLANFSDAVVEKGAKAGDLIKEIAPLVGGKGGGRPTMARGGGNDTDKVGDALAAARAWIVRKLA